MFPGNNIMGSLLNFLIFFITAFIFIWSIIVEPPTSIPDIPHFSNLIDSSSTESGARFSESMRPRQMVFLFLISIFSFFSMLCFRNSPPFLAYNHLQIDYRYLHVLSLI